MRTIKCDEELLLNYSRLRADISSNFLLLSKEGIITINSDAEYSLNEILSKHVFYSHKQKALFDHVSVCQREYDRCLKLSSRGLLTELELQRAQDSLNNASNEFRGFYYEIMAGVSDSIKRLDESLITTKYELELLRAQEQQNSLISPIDGQITEANVTRLGSSIYISQAICRIAPEDTSVIEGFMPVTTPVSLKPNTPVVIVANGESLDQEIRFSTEISSVGDDTATNGAGERCYHVKIIAGTPPPLGWERLRRGQFVSIRVHTGTKKLLSIVTSRTREFFSPDRRHEQVK